VPTCRSRRSPWRPRCRHPPPPRARRPPRTDADRTACPNAPHRTRRPEILNPPLPPPPPMGLRRPLRPNSCRSVVTIVVHREGDVCRAWPTRATRCRQVLLRSRPLPHAPHRNPAPGDIESPPLPAGRRPTLCARIPAELLPSVKTVLEVLAMDIFRRCCPCPPLPPRPTVTAPASDHRLRTSPPEMFVAAVCPPPATERLERTKTPPERS